MNARLAALCVRGREAVRRVEGMTSGGKGKVLADWEVEASDGEGEGAESGGGSEVGEEVGAVD